MDDRALIAKHGGPAKLAKLLGFTSKNGTQRVSNWQTRGIPARIKLDYPTLFLTFNEPGDGAGAVERDAPGIPRDGGQLKESVR